MKARELASCLLLAALLASCASSPRIVETKASLTVAAIEELKSKYGYTFSVNPYLEPVSLLRGKKNEFVVLKVGLELAAPSRTIIEARVLSPEGKDVAEAKSKYLFELYWSLMAEDEGTERRATNLNRSYFPDGDFVARKGRSEYFFVLVGPNPIPRPAKLDATLYIDGMPPIGLEYELPPLPEKKK